MQQQHAVLVPDAKGYELVNPGNRDVDGVGQVRCGELGRHAHVDQQRAVAQVIRRFLGRKAVRVAEQHRESEEVKDDEKNCPFHVL